jgi:hypothetical protein
MRKEKLWILIALIIGLSIIFSQIIKQNSIERQQDAELRVKQEALAYEKEQDKKAEEEKSFQTLMLNSCLASAEDGYWNYMELNGTGDRVEGVKASTWIWDTAKKDKKTAEDSCYRKFNK